MDAIDGEFLCKADLLLERGRGIRFRIRMDQRIVPAFAIRFDGRVHAFLNQCAHQAVELDWQPGQFFDTDGNLLVCATHGALYDPASGACRGGRCGGRGLTPVAVEEIHGSIYLAAGSHGVQLCEVEFPEG